MTGSEPERRAAWERDAVPAGEYEGIAEALASPQSPVGIDAKHTHVLILHALERIERRLEALERALQRTGTGSEPGSPS
jgi:hypothetical protein